MAFDSRKKLGTTKIEERRDMRAPRRLKNIVNGISFMGLVPIPVQCSVEKINVLSVA
jgi:hypothetical protein